MPIPIEIHPEKATPVFGTAQPRVGLIRWLKRQAYQLHIHDPRRWYLLILADRVETASELTREAITPGQQYLVVRHFARQARAHPEGVAALAAVVIGSAALARAGIMLYRRYCRPEFA